MDRIAFIDTPASFENIKDTSGLRELAKTLFPAEHFISSEPGIDLNIVLKKFKKLKINHIIISSGDGTIARVMTAIMHTYPENKFPKLTVLPSGNTNLIAYAVGATRRDLKYLQDIVLKKMKLRSVWQRTLKLSFPGSQRLPQLGMFGGAGFFETAVTCSRGEIEKIAPHRLAILGTILKISMEIIFSKKEDNTHYQGIKMPWKNSKFHHFSQDIFFTLITSLEKLPYRIWPFWNTYNQEKEGFSFLRISSFPKSFPRAIIPLVRGKISPWIKNSKDYQSDRTSRISAELKDNFILDGEFIPPSETGNIEISLGPKIEFLV